MANAKLFQSKLFDINGGNSGGVSNYEELSNLPKINGTVLKGDLSATDLGLAGLNYKGTITNELPSEEPNNGDFWVVTENVDDLAGISFEAGDWLIWNNGKWDKIENFDAVSQDDIQQINEQIADIYSQFSLKQNVITGNEGEVAYYNGKEIETKPILREDYICVNDEEVELCKGAFELSFSEAFQHSRGNCFHDESIENEWFYNDTTKLISQNSLFTDYTGIITSKSYSNYDLKVRAHVSSNRTGGCLGLVTGFAVDNNGDEHTLSFICNRAEFICKIDHCTKNLHGNTYGSFQYDKTFNISGFKNNGEDYITVQVQRMGNIIIGKCSDYNDDELKYEIIVNLDDLSSKQSVFNLFKGHSPYGFAVQKQIVGFENISFDEPNGRIYKLPYTVYEYDYDKSEWVENSELKPLSEIGIGRFAYNSKTQKLFYTTRSKVIQVADISHNQLPPFTSEDEFKVLTIDNGQTVWSQLENDKHLKGGWKEVNVENIDTVEKRCLKNGSAVYNLHDSILYIYNNGNFEPFGVNSVIKEQLEELQQRLESVEADIIDLYKAQIRYIMFKIDEQTYEIKGEIRDDKGNTLNNEGSFKYYTTEDNEIKYNITEVCISSKKATYPSVTIVDDYGEECFCGVQYIQDDGFTIKLKFKDTTEFSGKVYLN